MKKIGIITHYYLSKNYGGNLQAYALAKYINSLEGFEAEQICFSFLQYVDDDVQSDDKILAAESIEKKTVSNRIISAVRYPVAFLKKAIRYLKYYFSLKYLKTKFDDCLNDCFFSNFTKRENSIKGFNQGFIPHSKEVYYENNLNDCLDLYDAFVTGSDQVWSGCSDGYLLGFVNNKPKLSYAASVSRRDLSDEQKDFFRSRLVDYKAISVRDENDKRIISDLTDVGVEVLIDPVFLLKKSDWNSILPKEKLYKEKYIFCYFLGDNKKYKELAKKYARYNNLKIVFVPHFKNNINKVVYNDLLFGDYKPYDLSPVDFVSFINDAEYVFTDSFHAVAFSIIFKKQFFVFDRYSVGGSMNSRIECILNKFGFIDRFCYGNDKENLNYLKSLKTINYYDSERIINGERERSKQFLLKNL